MVVRQPQEGHRQRRTGFQLSLSCCELRLEVWLGPGITRTSDFHYIYYCFHFAEVRVLRSIRVIWEGLLRDWFWCSFRLFRFLYIWLSCLLVGFGSPFSGLDTHEH
jgi:hypothetical protein